MYVKHDKKKPMHITHIISKHPVQERKPYLSKEKLDLKLEKKGNE